MSENMFDSLPALAMPTTSNAQDELSCYLAEDTEIVDNALKWWTGKTYLYPRLSRMALDYLSIPGMLFIFLVGYIF